MGCFESIDVTGGNRPVAACDERATGFCRFGPLVAMLETY